MSTQIKAATVRTKDQAAAANGEPTLITSATSSYTWIWSDVGSGADQDVSIFRPVPSDTSFYIVGDYAQGNFNSPTGTSLIVKAVNDDPDNPLLKAPVRYEKVWDDADSGGDNDGSIWRPVAPDGYLSLGFVANAGYDQPVIANYMCIRKDLVTDSSAGGQIWSDKDSGANMDVTVYQLLNVAGAFVAQGNYEPYVGPAYKLYYSS